MQKRISKMEKKNKYLKLCLDPELEKEARVVNRGAILLSAAISVVATIVAMLMLHYLI